MMATLTRYLGAAPLSWRRAVYLTVHSQTTRVTVRVIINIRLFISGVQWEYYACCYTSVTIDS